MLANIYRNKIHLVLLMLFVLILSSGVLGIAFVKSEAKSEGAVLTEEAREDFTEQPEGKVGEAEQEDEANVYVVDNSDALQIQNPPDEASIDEGDTETKDIIPSAFKIADISQQKRSTVAGIQKLHITFHDTFSTHLIDISSYKEDVLSMLWDKGQLEFGLNTEKVVPQLRPVLVNDDFETNVSGNVSELISLDGKKYLFVRPDGVRDIEIHLYDPNAGRFTGGNVSVTANHSSGLKYSTLNIIPREEWSGDPNINDPSRLVWDPVYYDADKIVIHHTATPNTGDPYEWMRTIYSYHKNTLGMGDIGYNYVIDRYGRIYEGKLGGEEAKGYHAGDANANSIGISLIGDFTSVIPTSAARTALKKLMAEKAVFYDLSLSWKSTVYGHRDFAATACPGNDFYPMLPTLTVNARNYLDDFSEVESVGGFVEDDIDNSSFRPGKLVVIYKDAADIEIPPYSGVESYSIIDNSVGFVVTTNSSPYEDVNERLKTLYKVYKLDPDVSIVTVAHEGFIIE